MTSRQKDKRICKSVFKFKRHGQGGVELGETLPHLAGVADEIAVVRSMQTEAINHDPAVTFFPDRLPAGRPAQCRGVGELRTRQRERRSADLS